MRPICPPPPLRPVLLLEHCNELANLLNTYQLASCSCTRTMTCPHTLGGTAVPAPTSRAETIWPGDGANHTHESGGGPGVTRRMAKTLGGGGFQRQPTIFHVLGHGHTPSHLTHSTHDLPHTGPAHLQTCIHACHQQLCHVSARPPLAANFHQILEIRVPLPTLVIPRPATIHV